MKLDWKLASAFATGAVLACGIVYFSVKPAVIAPEALPRPAPTPKAPASQPVLVAKAMIPPAPAPAPRVAEVHVPIREKPSPMPPPVKREKPPLVARAETPPQPAPPVSKPVENVPAQNVSLPAQPPAPPTVESRVAPTVTLKPGTVLAVRLGQTLSSARNQPGDRFFATLTQPLVADGWVIAERGARVDGRVVDIAQAVQGGSRLEISIVRVALSDGQTLRLHTEPYAASVSNGVFFRKAAEIPIESRLTFRVLDPITITERVN